MLPRLPSVMPLQLDSLTTRSGASSGLWLVVLVPLACSPGFYTAFLQCSPPPRFLSLLAIQVGVCGMHLYQQICLSGKPGKNEEGVIEYSSSFGIRLLTHPYTPALVTAAAICVLTEINPFTAIFCTNICAWILYGCTQWLFKAFPGSFSLGEGAVAGQAAALVVTCSLHSVIIYLGNMSQLTESQEISLFIQTAVVVLSLFVFTIHKISVVRTPRMFLPVLCIFGVGGMALSSLLLGKWVPLWMLDVFTASSSRLTLLGCWGGVTVLAMLITVWARRTNGMETTVLRKVYHILIVLVFTPGIFLDLSFTHFAAAGTIMLLSLLEFIRMQRIEPVASVISTAFYTFLDEKDGGMLILSHIYLLAGVAAPLWLNPCPLDFVRGSTNAPSLLPLLAGVLAVGVGDTFASIGGTYLGRKRWSGTKKTVEGSLCGVISQLATVGLLVACDIVDVSWPVWGRLLVSTSLVAIVEALTDQVDNIVLPLLLYTSLMDL